MLISSGIGHQVSGLCPRTPEATRHRAERLGEGLGHRGGVERRAGGWSSDPMRKPVRRARARLECAQGRSCARPTGGTHGRTTGTPILLISIRFPLKKQSGAGHPEGYPGQITYSTRCNDDTARECTRFPRLRPATRARARGSASRRSTSKLLARALERRSAPLGCRRDPRWVGARGVR